MSTLFTGLVCNNKEYIHTPLIEIVPVKDDSQLRKALFQWYDDKSENVGYLLFTSRYSVKYWSLTLDGKDPQHIMPNKKVVSIGATTTLALVEAGFQDIEQVEEDNSYGVIDWFSNRERGQVLIPRSNLALNLIPDGLRELGFQVTTVTAYENIMPNNPKKVDLSEIDRIIFTSPSTIDNFVKLYGYLPTDKELKTRGVVTEKHLMEILNKNI